MGTLVDKDNVLAPVIAGQLRPATLAEAIFGSERLPRELLCQLLEALPAAVYTTDGAGRLTFYNQAAVDLWGLRPDLGRSQWCGSWRLHWPDGRPMPHDECPMAVALKEGRPIRGAEAVAERPDGTRVSFLAYPTPLCDESGTPIGAINMLVDISERKRAEELEQRLASIVEGSDDAIISKDLQGVIATWNTGATRLFGYTAQEVVGKPVTILIPSDRQDEEREILGQIRRGEHIDHYETVRCRKDGTLVEVSLTVSPVRDAEGRIIGASKIARDITERKRALEQQQLLLREMSHRVKNLFSVAGSVVALSTRSARTPEDMAEAVQERLRALARVQDMTLPGFIDVSAKPSQETKLHAIVRAIFAPYSDPGRDNDDGCVIVNGPNVPIRGSAVTSLALVLHEFTTNAAKYGALSSPNGCVHIDWRLVGTDKLLLEWKECGGPPIHGLPKNRGFGSALTERIIKSQSGGEVSYHWHPEGLIIHLSVPTDWLTR